MRVPLSLVAAASLGCGVGNAVFDGRVDLPATIDDTPIFAVVEAVRTTAFEVEWEGSALPESAELGAARSAYDFSLVSSSYADPLRLKIRFCREPTCTAVRGDGVRADPQAEVWVEVERPFYQGEFTAWRLELPDRPRCLNPDEDRCLEALPAALPDGCVLEPRTREVGYPTWFCSVARCQVECQRDGLNPVGWCVDGSAGDRGLHFCET